MGPKGKSNKQFAHIKSSLQTAQLTAQLTAKVKNMQDKMYMLTLDIEKLSFEYDQKVSELERKKLNMTCWFMSFAR